MSTELKQTNESMPVKIQEYTRTALALLELEAKYGGVVFDLSTADGMKAAKSARSEIKTYRIGLENTRVAIKSEALEKCQLIDSEARKIREALEQLEDPIDQQIKAEEKRKQDERIAAEKEEMERVITIQKAIISIRNLPSWVAGKTGAEIRLAIVTLEKTEISADLYAEHLDHAMDAKKNVIKALEKMAAEAEKLESERAELARLREEAEEEQRRLAEEQAEIERRKEQLRREEEYAKAQEQRRVQEAKEQAECEAYETQQRLEREWVEHAATVEMEEEIAVLVAEIQIGILSIPDALRRAYNAGRTYSQ